MTKDSKDLFKEVAIEILKDQLASHQTEWTVNECENIIKYSSVRIPRYIVGESSMFMFPNSVLIHPSLHKRYLSDLYSDLYTTEHALFEYPKPHQLIQELTFLIENLRERPKITFDLFCGSGIDLLGLASISDNITGVDVEEHSVALARINSKRFAEISNITIICDNALEVIEKIEVIPNLIYLDFPWGGIDYKKIRDIPLYVGEKELAEFCDELMIKYPTSRLFVKFPKNYQFYRVEHIPFRFQTIYKRDGVEVSYYVGIYKMSNSI
jgi:predicted RNA methylase